MNLPDDLLTTGLTNLAVVLACMVVLWIVSLVKKDASIVDPFWPVGFVIIAWASCAMVVSEPAARPLLIVVLTTIWGLRLGLYLLWRNWGAGEDYRYTEMREKHGDRFWIVSLFTVFVLQGVLMWVVSWPVQYAQTLSDSSIGWCDALVDRFRLRVGGRPPACAIQVRSREQGESPRPRPVALYAAPQLLRRLLRLVGALCDSGLRRCLVDDSRSALDVVSSDEVLRRRPSGKYDHRPPACIR